MITLHLIGIGTGNPDHVTMEARKAMAGADLILVPEKGDDKTDLADLRRQIVAEVCPDVTVEGFAMPVRDPALPYLERVERWHDAIAGRWAGAMARYPQAREVVLLVWGDPSLYDSTLRIAARLRPAPKLRVVPGITALQALTAAHAIPLNTVNGPVTITTGRRLRDHGWPEGAETVAVMLDGECSFLGLAPGGVRIWWGACLGMANQVLDAGPLAEAGPRIVAARAEARAAHGWIMDIYLLRRT
ncbi:MAG: precorrin-6A synthase (deacetylating) [Rhodobacteraceae bacterium]|nr:precorrin-6A synthase (deacetylating) [Paracoccaceae bacterium]